MEPGTLLQWAGQWVDLAGWDGLAAVGHRFGGMLVDGGSLFNKADLTTTGRNYLGMAASMANTLTTSLQSTINSVMPLAVIMKLVFSIMGATLTFHILAAILKGVQEGHPKGLITEIIDALWTNGPRVFIFALLSLAVAGVSNVNSSINTNATLMQSVYGEGDSEVVTMQQALRSSWGHEADAVPAPLLPLKTGVGKAINAVSALDLISVSRKVSTEIENAAKQGQNMAAPVAGSTTSPIASAQGADAEAPLLAMLVKHAIVPLGVVGEELAFIAAQYSMMKNLVATYIYLVLAWRLTLHFLPLMVCLAYFRSMQSFLQNAAKHLLALSIAGSVLGTLSSTLYDGAFWLGGVNAGGNYTVGTGLIGDIFKGIIIPAQKSNVFSPGSYPWLTVELYKYMGVIQVCALFGLVGVLLGEIYSLIRGTLDGVMRSSHSGSISSITGR